MSVDIVWQGIPNYLSSVGGVATAGVAIFGAVLSIRNARKTAGLKDELNARAPQERISPETSDLPESPRGEGGLRPDDDGATTVVGPPPPPIRARWRLQRHPNGICDLINIGTAGAAIVELSELLDEDDPAKKVQLHVGTPAMIDPGHGVRFTLPHPFDPDVRRIELWWAESGTLVRTELLA